MTAVTPAGQPLSAQEEAVVRALGRAILVLPRLMDADLVREQGLALNEYMALVYLSEAPERRMRMHELSVAAELSMSGMTRIVNRLEADGLVVRVRCEEDARGWNAVLTDAGLDRLQHAYPSHLASVRRRVTDHLAGMDLTRLAQVLERFATHPDPPG
jgi:DNA-binding MarR family transcriptional regulator